MPEPTIRVARQTKVIRITRSGRGPQGIQGPQGDPATNLVTSVAGRQGVVTLVENDIANLNSDLASKANDSAVIHNTGNETVAGIKTFSSAPVVPSSSFPESVITNLTTDLVAKYVKPGGGIPETDLASALQTKIDGAEQTSNKGVANGYAGLDGSGKVPTAQLPSSVLGALEYQGTYDASGSSYPGSPSKGYYWVISVAGTLGGVSYKIGDWLTYDGTGWDKIDNQQTVTSVAGRTGAIVLGESDIANLTTDLALKATDSLTVHLAGTETITGAKTFNAGSLLDKGNQVFDVRAYGAVGDGTTDDITAIRAAITAATTGGGYVFIPPGYTFAISDYITLSSNVLIIGEGKLSVIKQLAGSNVNNILRGTGISYSGLKNLTVDYNHQNNPSCSQGMSIATSSYVTVENCDFLNAKGFAIGFTGLPNSRNDHARVHNNRVLNPLSSPNDLLLVLSDYASVTDNHVIGSTANASLVLYESDHLYASGNIIELPTTSVGQHGIAIWSCRYSTVIGNKVMGASGSIYGITLATEHDNASPTTSGYNLIADNEVDGLTIAFHVSETINDNVQGNKFWNVTHAVQFPTGDPIPTNLVIQRNDFSNVSSSVVDNVAGLTQLQLDAVFRDNNGYSSNGDSAVLNRANHFTDVITSTAALYNYFGRSSALGDTTVSFARSLGEGDPTVLSGTVAIFQSNNTSSFGARVGIVAGSIGTSTLDFGNVNNQAAGSLSWNNNTSVFTLSGGDFSIIGHKIINLNNPSSAQDAATKAYVDSVAAGLSIKASVQEATTAALASNVYNNGSSGVGATLTGVSFGALSIDGVTPVAGDRVLVQNEVTASHNGIYIVTTVGAVATLYVLTRTTDMNQGTEVPGAFTFCEQGTANANSGFVCTTTGTVTMGTTSINFTQFSGAGEITAGSGLSKSGNTISIAAGGVTNAMLAGSIAASNLISTDITTVGTVTSGIWHGTIITSAYGGTGNGYTKFSGPASSEKTFTLPNASATILTDNAVVTVAQGGTNATSASVTSFNNITGYTASGATGTTSSNLVFSASPTFTGTINGGSGITFPAAATIQTSASYLLILATGDAYIRSGSGNGVHLNDNNAGIVDIALGGGAVSIGGTITISDAKNIILNTTTGTKIGTSTSQKLAFYNSTPIVQPTGDVITGLQNLGLIASATISESDVTSLTSDLALKAPLASPTFTGTVTLPSSTTLTTPVINGTPTGTGVDTAATASTLALRDSNANLSINNVFDGFTTTATATGTTTLTISSTPIQIFTGTHTQTVILPTTSIPAGAQFTIINQSTGAVTVQSSGANTITVVAAATSAIFTAVVATPTTAANWNSQYIGIAITSGKVLTITNSGILNLNGKTVGFGNNLTFNGTDNTTMTLPSSSDTIAGLAATQAFTNKDLTGAGNTFPTLNQNTTGSAAKLTTARNINGVAFDGSANINTEYIEPSNHNVLAWTYDPVMAANSQLLPTAGLLNVIRIFIPYAMTISNIITNIATAGNTLANSYVALYQSNTLLAQSADQSTNWQSSGTKTIAITPQAVAAGSVEVVIWCGSWNTAPKLLRAADQTSSMANLGLSAANSRYATADGSITTTAPGSLGTHSQSSTTWWFALS